MDGEKLDNVSHHKKPRIKVYPKMLVATAEKCLIESTAKYVIHEKTDIRTQLGPIVIIEILKEGNVLVAGPSTNSEMKKVINMLKKYNPLKIFIDGALFRKSFATKSLSDGVILSTGASYNRDMDLVVNVTKSLIDQLSISDVNNEVKNYIKQTKNSVLFNENFNESILIKEKLLENEDLIKKYLDLDYDYFFIRGALTDRILDVFINNRHSFNKMNIILEDSTHILINPQVFQKLSKLGLKISVLNPIDILFVTYNPYSPFGYEFDNDKFRIELEKITDKDIINVLKDLE